MRFVRVTLGLPLALVGVVVTLAGAASAFWLVGPDSTVDTGEQRLTSRGLAVATAPNLLDRHGFTLHVTAASSRPVFVGVGHDLDVSSYLGRSAYTRVVRFDLPSDFATQEMKGATGRLNPPTGLDWWLADAAGPGERSAEWETEDGAYDVVVMNADGTPGVDATVTFGVELKGLFGICLVVLGVGLILLFLGVWLLLPRRRQPGATSTPTQQQTTPYAGAGVQYPLVPQAPVSPPPVKPVEAPEEERQPVAPPPVKPVGAPVGKEQPEPDEPEDEPTRRPEPVPGIPPQYQAPAYSPPRLKRVGGLLTGGMLLLTATGCVAIPQQNTSSGPVTRAAVTVADGLVAVQKYNELNNRANQARDAKLSEAIETGPTLAMTRAGYQIGRKTDEAGKDKVKPFTYTQPSIGAPQYGSYPMRFVVASGVSTSPDSKQLGVWERATAGDPWTLKYSVYPSASMKLPPLEGLRTPTKADMSKLASLPQTAAANLAAYLTGGPQSPQAALFTPSPGTDSLLNQRAKDKIADTKKPYIATAIDTFRPSGDPLTFITPNGEALVFLALTEQYLQHIEPGSNAYWTSGPPTAFSSYVKYTQTLHQDYLHQLALVIPAKGQGKIQILSLDGQLVGAGGS
ncbi:hypothetical protein BWI15_33850 [Kribbella sp. ALI-6-A]|uniref:hypothetical protein n=1 Tax=Kribbella sp. ALI-6-A TaxID=1933817 RepID=UPI00097BCEFB|nr:hypothetical protein [Kribbella sp. ALI-6-A]ONI68038.1 hypothetical protein BWI15_33850 [Kribbella sp. ALI-6-A]